MRDRADADADSIAEEDAAPAEAERQKVLVVDDEIGIRKGCQRVLSAEGHEVLLAEDGHEGLETLRQNPDTGLVLVDLKMPVMGGLEFLAHMGEIAPEAVCVVITAYASIEAAIEATKRGAYDLLTKPFTPDELLRVANKALDRVRLVRDRERRLLQLATERTRLRTVINCMADAIMVCNPDGELALYNPAALRVLAGLTPEDGLPALRDVLHPSELVEMVQEVSDQHTHLSREVRIDDTAEGAWVLADVAPIPDEASGAILGTVTVLRDITELKRIEQVKAQFVNMVAHELRAPVAAVVGYLSVILEGIAVDPARQIEMLQRSDRRLRALLDLVADLLDVSRMEAGTVRREIAVQNLGEVAAEVAELMRPLADEKAVTVQTEIPADPCPVEADREELIRLMNNLVSNAIKYNTEGGRVTVSCAEEPPYVKITVADTGVGISEDGLGRLFSEFFREKRPENADITGTGLGLSIVKRIVDLYHGRIDVQSTLGEGTTFTIWLPCKCEAAQQRSGSG